VQTHRLFFQHQPLLMQRKANFPHHLDLEVGLSLAEIEKESIRATLKHVENNKAKAAKILGVSKRTIFRKIKEYDLSDD
jgi:transcriptional regulator with PAS, ATPase and Fis domain